MPLSRKIISNLTYIRYILIICLCENGKRNMLIKNVRAKNLFLRLVPYVISLAAGGLMYFWADAKIKDEGLNGLLVNIASGLLSIPLVFIFYELVNDACSRDIKKTMLEHLNFDLNYTIIEIIKTIRKMLNVEDQLDRESLDILLHRDKKFIKNHLQLSFEYSPSLQFYKTTILDAINSGSNSEVLSDGQVKTLLSLAKHLGIMSKELEQIDAEDKILVAESLSEILALISTWIDLGEEDALLNHHSFKLI